MNNPLMSGTRGTAACALLGAVLLSSTALANGEYEPTYLPEMEISSARGEIAVDGVLDDAGWRGLPRAAGFAEHNPGDQTRPPVDTTAMMTYSESHLYVAFVCQDDPSLIRATFTERDNIFNDDYVIFCLDTFGDQAFAYEIAVNPLGIQGDLLWSGSGGEDINYDLIFESAASITDHGWQVELAIPLTSLKFPDMPEQSWRVDFWRNHPRESRRQYSWAAYDRDEQCWPCQWGTVHGIQGIKPGEGIEILPSVVGSHAGSRDEDDGAWSNEDVTGDFGVSASYGISSAFTAEGTYNPDFSQVESDAAQIDVNTSFALFFPERRPFFQEGSDLFNTWFNVVYTRSINDPSFATKVTGRPGKTNIAYLVARDENTPFIVPFGERSEIMSAGKSTSNIVRVRHALGDNSHVGAIATDRRLDGGGSGTVAGVDTRIRLNQNYQVEFQALATHTEEPDDLDLTADFDQDDFDRGGKTAAFDGESYWGDAIYASLERSGRTTNFDLDFYQRSPTFRTENGFEFRNDRRQGAVSGGYTWFRENRFMDRVGLWSNVARVWDYAGTLKDEWVNISLEPRFQWAQSSLHASWMTSNENYRSDQFDGIYLWHICSHTQPFEWLRGGANYNFGHRIARGDLVMGEEIQWGFWATIKPMDRLEVYTTFTAIRSDALSDRFEDGEQTVVEGERLFEGYITRTRATLQLTRELSARIVLQYNDFDEAWELDPLVTFRLNPFSIFYVGSTRDYGRFTTGLDQVEQWKLGHRQYFMKLQYLFQI